MSTIVNACVLAELAGILPHTGTSNHAVGLALLEPLAGALELRGVNNHDGSPAVWSFEAGASGAFSPPGTGDGFFHAMNWAFSDPNDVGHVFIAWRSH